MKKFKRLGVFILVVVLSLSVLAGCSSEGNEGETDTETESDSGDKPEVSIGYVNWSDSVALTELAKVVLEDKMDYDVNITMADAGVVFTSVAEGDTDFYLDFWLPVTFKDYYEELGDDLELLGTSYDSAEIGLAVPEYMDIDSIDELNDYKEEFGEEIVGIDSGAGVVKNTKIAIEEYGLDYELITGSEPVMTASLSDALDNEEPIVVTAWKPHWKFARWDIKFLEDPKNVYGDGEESFIIGRKGTEKDMPEVHEFIENFHLEMDEIAELMDMIENGDNAEESAREWMNENEDKVEAWIPEK